MSKTTTRKPYKHRGGKFLPALCRVLGTLILLAVIAACVPLSVPRLLGYEIYNVVSGSMAPTIPTGSVVYVKACEPDEIKADDVIAFRREDVVVTHRVVENYGFDGKLVTKGDANESKDFDPVPYTDLIGTVRYHLPALGTIFSMLSSTAGKIYLLVLAACGVMFNILGSRLRVESVEKELLQDEDAMRELSELQLRLQSGPQGKRRKSRGKRILRGVLMTLALIVFAGSFAGAAAIQLQYKKSEVLYDDAVQRFTVVSEPTAVEIPIAPPAPEEPTIKRLPEKAPITVDFEALRRVNPDIEGWIYCAGTVINYPVLHGETNDSYIHTSYDKTYNAAGSIFVEERNLPGFVDPNTILYGHHMGDKSMFATLDRWQGQEYFDAHPVMWLLTPTQDYKLSLYSAYNISAYDEVYTIYHENVPEFQEWIQSSLRRSEIASDTVTEPEGQYIMLSTCAYVFDNARSVVHALMQPVSSAGGEALTDRRIVD